MRPFVVSSSDRPKSLLSCSIPNLKFDYVFTWLDCSDLEIDTNGGEETLTEDIVREPQEETGLSDRGIPNKYNFKQVVVLLMHRLTN